MQGLNRTWRFVLAALLWTLVPSAGAWHTLTHPLIIEGAYEELPTEIKQAFSTHLDEVKRGAITPDLIGDWGNHEIDLHPSTDFSFPSSILHLQLTAAEVFDALQAESPDAAQRLGEFLHYIQDHVHPLHTGNDPRETPTLHRQQEQLTYARRDELPQFDDPGIRRWEDILAWAEAAVPRANRLYTPWLEAAVAQSDSLPLAARAFRQAVAETRDLWVSLWYQAFPVQSNMHLHVNRTQLQPGQGVILTLSPVVSDTDADIDVELSWMRVSDRAVLKTETASLTDHKTVIDAPLIEGAYWLSAQHRGNIDWVLLEVARRPFFELSTLNPAGYVLNARWPHSIMSLRQYVRPWDFIAFGGCQDDPLTDVEEGLAGPFIPGDFIHMGVYLGRDAAGRPIMVELLQGFGLEDAKQFRVAVLPEGIDDEAPDRLALSEVEVSLKRCAWRWSRPLKPTDRDALEAVSDQLVRTLQSHWEDQFPYQLPFALSGGGTGREILLIDDGLEGGANCGDYWLALYEDIAGVCLSGTRMTADEITDYFLNDPVGSRAEIPASFNPLPVRVTANSLLYLGYRLIDPPPHRFNCDATEEIGIVMPSRLMLSPDLGQPWSLPTATALPKAAPWWSWLGQAYHAMTPWLQNSDDLR